MAALSLATSASPAMEEENVMSERDRRKMRKLMSSRPSHTFLEFDETNGKQKKTYLTYEERARFITYLGVMMAYGATVAGFAFVGISIITSTSVVEDRLMSIAMFFMIFGFFLATFAITLIMISLRHYYFNQAIPDVNRITYQLRIRLERYPGQVITVGLMCLIVSSCLISWAKLDRIMAIILSATAGILTIVALTFQCWFTRYNYKFIHTKGPKIVDTSRDTILSAHHSIADHVHTVPYVGPVLKGKAKTDHQHHPHQHQHNNDNSPPILQTSSNTELLLDSPRLEVTAETNAELAV